MSLPSILLLVRREGFGCHYCHYQWPAAKAKLLSMVARGGNRAPTVDHLTPRSRGGSDHMRNLAACCQKCNSDKAHLTEAEFVAVRHDRRALLAARNMTLHLTMENPDAKVAVRRPQADL